MTAGVAALHISEDNVSEETATAETGNDAQNETYDSECSFESNNMRILSIEHAHSANKSIALEMQT
jgi:hypothetical protein